VRGRAQDEAEKLGVEVQLVYFEVRRKLHLLSLDFLNGRLIRISVENEAYSRSGQNFSRHSLA
jgi:hypothetical protein